MEKNTHETYDFLPANDEVGNDQYFVIHDNGTFLYQFMLPDGESNLYSGQLHLPQPDTVNISQQGGENSLNEYKAEAQNINIDNAVPDNKQNSNMFTEITLSDEQYKLLEQKGWILLESQDKIFVLNTLGLHDITANDKLIQKLRNELQSCNEVIQGCPKAEEIASPLTTILQDLQKKPDAEYLKEVNSTVQHDESIENLRSIVEKAAKDVEDQIVDIETSNTETSDNVKYNAIIELNKEVDINSLKIKTKHVFEDIPEKIYLGKTRTGKNLYAKISHCTKPLIIYESIVENQQFTDPDMDKTQFLNLVYTNHQFLSEKSQLAVNISAAKSAITQILKTPNLRHYIEEQNLFMTRITHKKNDIKNMHYKSKPSLLTGLVKFTGKDHWEFKHVPNILNIILKSTVKRKIIDEDKDTNFVHIHILEVKSSNNVQKVSLTLAKRQLCFNSVNEPVRRSAPIYACSACATVFTSEDELITHQETECAKDDGPQTMDTNDAFGSHESSFAIIENGIEKLYCCQICDTNFSDVSSCQEHLKTHNTDIQNGDIDSTSSQQSNATNKNKKTFKCKMCPEIYYHQCTLSKHILKKHLKLK